MNSCRHFLGLIPTNKRSCAKGRDVRAWAIRCNGGRNHGIGLRLPCTKHEDGWNDALFNCPELDRRTDKEVAEQAQEASEHIDRIMAGMSAINKMKPKMIHHNLKRAKATCPWCGEKDALKLSCAIGVNNHIHARCSACGQGFME